MQKKFTNNLIRESSPYLLQHAHNPVNWYAWGPEALAKARTENKPLLISIGYAACHWCHVMEHETFEDEEAATVMNANFINIKIDREERPDIDQLYMNAVQIMTGHGGWPLNVIALPDGKPFWGGTYFKKKQWINSLTQIAGLYQNDPEKIEEYAQNLSEGLKTISLVEPLESNHPFNEDEIINALNNWSRYFDHEYGGPKRAPKFMMPVNLNFLLQYAVLNTHEELLNYVNLTLTKMAYGGLYDHIGGGFSRYSVDEKWHVPHFEKMLYDNAQLVSVYSKAWLVTGNPLYRQVVKETLSFVERELYNQDGFFYSSLDADSINPEGKLEEGAFYVWKKEELEALLADDFNLFAAYYNINSFGYWENGNYVLIRSQPEENLALQFSTSVGEISEKIQRCKLLLFNERSKRPRPRLDDKTLSSWNALMITAYCEAYKAFGEANYLNMAKKCMGFLQEKQLQPNGALFHNYKNGKSTIAGFLEDYAFMIEACLALYQVTFEEGYLTSAKTMALYCFDHFFDENSGMFFFTSDEEEVVVTKTIEKSDNVIPASNSVMAINLFKLGHYFSNERFIEISKKMLNNLRPDLEEYGYSHANWLSLMQFFTKPFYEIAVVGNNAFGLAKQVNAFYIPNCVIGVTAKESQIPLLKNRFVPKETFIYVCENQHCQLPVKTIEDAIKLIKA